MNRSWTRIGADDSTSIPTVLIVDTDPVTRRQLARSIKRHGFDVVVARNGVEALDSIPVLQPDALVMDVDTPPVDGIDACQALRMRCPDTQLPILMITGCDDDDAVDRAYAAGATDFIDKPVNHKVLAHRLRYLVRAGAAMRELSTAVDELDHNREKLHELAFMDTLTGLPNRTAFLRTMDRELARAAAQDGRCALMFLDVDNFKRVNDTLGHGAGDALLTGMAERLRGTVRVCDTFMEPYDTTDESGVARMPLVARLGGDEFTVLLAELDDDSDVASIAQRIVTAVNEPIPLGEHELVISTSIGIAVFPRDGADAETLLKHADAAMYLAKNAGKNGYCFHAASPARLPLDQLTMEARLRHALEKDALSLVYQPQLDLQTGAILGVEALLRWNDADAGAIAPDVFIPIAEASGLIVPIGLWVLNTACRAMAQWRAEGLGLVRVAVNISVRQFLSERFVEDVADALASSGLPAAALELEITESLLMEDVESAIDVLDQLKSLGVDLAIDDFGTGYSSLGYLKRFPIDRLKIDRIFVRDILSSSDDAAITRAVIAMAHSMDLTVVAEGVESAEQLRFLTDLDCEEVQGYLLSHPLPASEVAPFVRASDRTRQHAA